MCEEVRVLLGALDQGTSSTRFVLFDGSGGIVALAQKEHAQYHPFPGWVEQDLDEIWSACEWCIGEALSQVEGPYRLGGLGVATQRETVCVWDGKTGAALRRAVSWNCGRTIDVAERLKRQDPEREAWSRLKTGLPTASYFSATKLKWLLEEEPELFFSPRSPETSSSSNEEEKKRKREDVDVCVGTVDSFLLRRLTGEFVTDVTNASRTLLCGLGEVEWDADLLRSWGFFSSETGGDLPFRLARIEASIGGDFGRVKAGPLAGVAVAAVLGDQQAAAFGQLCFAIGDAKVTFGTGAFVLMNLGETPPSSKDDGLLRTPLYQIRGRRPVFALEGAVAVAGESLKWLTANLGFATTTKALCATACAESNGGVYFVPAFNGLFAPYWDPTARGAILGLTAYANKTHIVRAAIEAAAFQLDDLLQQFDLHDDPFLRGEDRQKKPIKVDGGMAANDSLLQCCADLLERPIQRPRHLETTAAGAAFAAGLALGIYTDLRHLATTVDGSCPDSPLQNNNNNSNNNTTRLFLSAISPLQRNAMRHNWKKALERSRGWQDHQQGGTTKKDNNNTNTAGAKGGSRTTNKHGTLAAAATLLLALPLIALLLRRRCL